MDAASRKVMHRIRRTLWIGQAHVCCIYHRTRYRCVYGAVRPLRLGKALVSPNDVHGACYDISRYMA